MDVVERILAKKKKKTTNQTAQVFQQCSKKKKHLVRQSQVFQQCLKNKNCRNADSSTISTTSTCKNNISLISSIERSNERYAPSQQKPELIEIGKDF
jgi:hypothetical protein